MENIQMKFHQKDYILGMTAGALIGLLFLPILKNFKPELFYQFFFLIVPFFLIAVPLGLYVADIISRKIAVIAQLSKFVVIGGLNTMIDIGTLALLSIIFKKILFIESTHVMIGIWGGITFYSFYKAISFIVANINSYLWNKYWTFQAIEKRSAGEFAQFFTISVVGFFLNVTIASYVFGYINPIGGLNISQWELIGAAAGSLAALTWNFTGYKFLVFKK